MLNIELESGKRYLRELGIVPNSAVKVNPSRGTSYRATYIGLLVEEHGVVAVVRVFGVEELRAVHYSRLEQAKFDADE